MSKHKHYERKNKLFAVGTLSTCKGNSGYKLYREMFKTEWIQPMRKEIFEKAADYPEEIDSYISYIYEDKLVINNQKYIYLVQSTNAKKKQICIRKLVDNDTNLVGLTEPEYKIALDTYALKYQNFFRTTLTE